MRNLLILSKDFSTWKSKERKLIKSRRGRDHRHRIEVEMTFGEPLFTVKDYSYDRVGRKEETMGRDERGRLRFHHLYLRILVVRKD